MASLAASPMRSRKGRHHDLTRDPCFATEDRVEEMAEALSVWCLEELACARARCRLRTQRSAAYRNRDRQAWEVQEELEEEVEEELGGLLFATPGRPAREDLDVGCWKSSTVGCSKSSTATSPDFAGSSPAPSARRVDGLFFSNPPVGLRSSAERRQHIGVLLLRRLNVPQSRPDNRIRYEDWSRTGRGRVRRRKCSDAIEIWRGEAAEVRQGEPIDARQRELLEIRQREAPKLGKKLALAAPMTVRAARDSAITGTWLEATCGAAVGLLVPLRFLVRCFGHLRARLAQSRDSSHRRSAKQKSHRGDKQAWLARLAHPNSPQIMGSYG